MTVELCETIVPSKFSLKDIGIIGNSPPIKALARQIETTARCDLTVLITGESGTGKELVARAIHQQSERAELPFISINCGALSEGLLESELFGYERGAFTGANQKQKGLFQAAHTGTIFLDEIGEVSPACQVKLLRVLQEGAVRPIGGHTEIAVDVRVITATNRTLHQEISAGRFREDLFYRVAVMTIDTPPLRKRSSDIPLLVEHFLRQAEQKMRCPYRRKIEEEGLATLSAYTWPGNVRQLRNVIERLVAITFESELITTEAILRALPASLLSEMATQLPVVFRENDSLDDFLDRMLLRAYEQLRKQTGSHSKAARLLRTDRVSLYQRIARARQRINASVAPGEAG
jgi:transcriptional regulator with PAS, ATPase and Fis domain